MIYVLFVFDVNKVICLKMFVLFVVYGEGCVIKAGTEGYVIFWQETGSTGVT